MTRNQRPLLLLPAALALCGLPLLAQSEPPRETGHEHGKHGEHGEHGGHDHQKMDLTEPGAGHHTMHAVSHEPWTPPEGLTVADFAFIGGSWSARVDGAQIEETWLPPVEGTMVGAFRDLTGEHPVFRHLQLEESPHGIVLRVSEGGGAWASYTLSQYREDDYAIFSSPDREFPRDLVYWGVDGQLIVRADGESDGRPRSRVWWYRPAGVRAELDEAGETASGDGEATETAGGD